MTNKTEHSLLTFIAVCYNHATYVTKTLDSILSQNCDDSRLIIVDDYSNDDSVLVITNWIKQNKVKCDFIEHKNNKGLCFSLNEAIRLTKSKYIKIIACDDVIIKDSIKQQIEILENTGPDIALICGNALIINENDNEQGEYFPKTYCFPNNVFKAILKGHAGKSIVIHTPTVLLKRQIYDDLGLYPENIIQEDFFMWACISLRYKIIFKNQCYVKYRILQNSLSNDRKNRLKILKDRLLATELISKKFTENSTQQELLTEQKKILRKILAYYLTNLNSKNKIEYDKFFKQLNEISKKLDDDKTATEKSLTQLAKFDVHFAHHLYTKYDVSINNFLLKVYLLSKIPLYQYKKRIKQKINNKESKLYKQCIKLTRNKTGLEIGGPSKIFGKEKHILRIYPVIKQLDNATFSTKTMWEGNIHEGASFHYDPNSAAGNQFTLEATNLHLIPSEQYDFIISSHVIEHLANPLLAISEWTRVLKNNGIVIMVIPHFAGTFDHQRPVTSLDHLIEDFKTNTKEDDLTHLSEILKHHDFKKDPGVISTEAFKNRSLKNYENRGLHHHVFNTSLAVNMINYMKLQILGVEAKNPCHIIVLAQKKHPTQQADNKHFIGSNAAYKKHSPFKSDRD